MAAAAASAAWQSVDLLVHGFQQQQNMLHRLAHITDGTFDALHARQHGQLRAIVARAGRRLADGVLDPKSKQPTSLPQAAALNVSAAYFRCSSLILIIILICP